MKRELKEERDLLIMKIQQLFSFTRVYAMLVHSTESTRFEEGKEYGRAKHTMIYLLFSYLYSVFDKNGVMFRNELFPDIDPQVIVPILEEWTKIQNKIERMRHNQGFHSFPKYAGVMDASMNFRSLESEGVGIAFDLIHALKEVANKAMDS